MTAHELCIATSGTDRRGTARPARRAPRRAARSRSPSSAPSLALADAYSTAALALGADAPDLLRDLDADGFPSLHVRADGEVLVTPGWPGLHQRQVIA